MKSTSTLLGLTIIYAVVFLFSALEPNSRAVWFAEIFPAIGILIAIWIISIRYQFSNTAYVLMFIWLCLHTVGAKYTFAECSPPRGLKNKTAQNKKHSRFQFARFLF
ncbi:hypothetical protein CTH30272_00972 [Allocatenococcus thiocycli]|nr:hypothetical protein CTH30272_00972 [Catenococcus thiocycli]